MGSLGRRLFFALPVVAPLAVPVATAAAAQRSGVLDIRSAAELGDASITACATTEGRLVVSGDALIERWDWCPLERRLISPSCPRDRDLAATLGIPYDGPRPWTDAETAATLGIETDAAARDRLVAAGKVAPDATPEQAVETFRAARSFLDGKGEG